MIIYNRQNIKVKDIAIVTKALLEDKITTGKYVGQFENGLSKYLGVKYVISCNSGTSSLMMAVASLNLKKNSNVIIPAVNFVAAANICKFFGYNIFFSDVDKSNGLMTTSELEKCIKKNKIKKVDLIFTMHLGGNVEQVDKFYKLKKKLNSFLIEDACHAFGSDYYIKNKKYKVGCSKHVDISTFSFHALKTITTGEGGAVTTNNKLLYKKIKDFRSHGMTNKKDMNYNIDSVGLNFRLSDINCALGLSQLKQINHILQKRKEIFDIYYSKLNGYRNLIKIIKPKIKSSSYHLLLANINFDYLKINKTKFFKIMKKKGILCQFHYIPIYKFKNHYRVLKLPNAELYYKNFISLPIHCKLNLKSVSFVIKSIKNILDKNLKTKKLMGYV